MPAMHPSVVMCGIYAQIFLVACFQASGIKVPQWMALKPLAYQNPEPYGI